MAAAANPSAPCCYAFLVMVAILGHVTQAAYDRTVCDTDAFKQEARNNPGPGRPVLASQYSVRVEANLAEAKRTVDVHEFYDAVNNRGALVRWNGGVESRVLYDFSTDQLITVTLPDRADPTQHFTRCEVQSLSSINNSTVFGARKYSNGTEHIYSIADTLRMATNQPQIYMGQMSVSDVIADVWKSCIYMPTLDATFNATWYFTANNTWTSTVATQAPVSLHVQGRVGGAHAHDFDHVYSFSEYRPNFEDVNHVSNAFETPQGVYCPGRVNTMPLPNVTDNFSFSSEIVDMGTSSMTYLSEYYDYAMRVMRYEFQSLTRIHDFNTGVAYNIDRVTGKCRASRISDLGFDAESQDAAFIRMETSEQFFDFTNKRYTYTGQRTVRDIECDVWVTVNDHWPPESPFQTNWEWYFATTAWIESVGYQYEVRLPVQLRITAQNFDPPFERIFNFYDYKEGQNQPWQFSISACFSSQHRREYTLTIPGNYSQWVAPNLDNFLYFFVIAVTAHARVSFMRVANVKFDFDDTNIYASFSLLDKAPIAGDVKNTEPEIDLSQAGNHMESDITSGAFFVLLELHDGDVPQRLQVTRFTLDTASTLQSAPAAGPPPPRQQHHQQPQPLTQDDDAAALPRIHQQQLQRHGVGSAGGGQIELDVSGPASIDSDTSYTAGAMAGMGVAMVTVGFGLGFILTVLAHRCYHARVRLEVVNPLTVLR